MKATTFCKARTLMFFAFFSFSISVSNAQTNKGLVFDGFSAYADLGIMNPTGNFSNGFTIECWVMYTGFMNWSRIIDLGNGEASDNILFANQMYDNNLRFEVYNDGTAEGISGPNNMELHRWYHVAVTLSGGYAIMYIDGQNVASGPVQMPANIDRYNNYIGRSNWAFDDYLDGLIDELRIWDVARTQSEIRDNMFKPVAGNTPGLVSFYRANEGSGSLLSNTATNGGAGNGTFYGGWATLSNLVSPNALNFDGSDDYVYVGTPLPGGTSYTKEAWVYITNNTALPNNILSSASSPFWIDGNLMRAGNNGPAFEVTDVTNFPTNTWVHVAVTYNSGNGALRLYRNGVLVGSGTSSYSYTGEENYIGAWYNTENMSTESFFGGNIDEVRIWNVARTQAEIQANMNRELNAASYPNLVSYYNFNLGTPSGANYGFQTLFDQKWNSNGTLFNFTLFGSTTNYVSQANTLTTLPVKFGTFTAVKQGNNVFLQWNTLAEENTADFVVQHSVNGTTWTPLTTIAAAGNSTTLRTYDYLHTTPVLDKNLYRILQRDQNGTTSVSKINTVLFNQGRQSFVIMGNVIENGSIQLDVKTPSSISLHSQDGKMIWTKKLGAGLQTIDVSSVAKGIYILRSEGLTERILIK